MDRLERSVARKMAPALAGHGFSLRPAWSSFVRDRPHGHDRLFIVNQRAASAGPRHHEINVFCAVRHDRVESAWNALGLVYGDAQLETSTLLLTRARAAPALKVQSETLAVDTDHVANQGLSFFTEIALPFFAQYADVAAVERLANQRPLADLDPFSVGGPMEHRAMRSLILASLAKPDRYPSVRDEFIRLNKGMYPLAQRMAMLEKIDAVSRAGAGAAGIAETPRSK